MDNYKKIANKEQIYKIILKHTKSKVATKLAEFLSNVGENLTYDISRDRYIINSFYPSFPSKSWDRLIQSLEDSVDGKRVLYQSDIVVTGKCHCNCWHCYRNKFARYDLDSELIHKFIVQSYDLGVATCGITGGEPMLRNDIGEIIGFLPDGMEGQLYTTGYHITEEFCDIINQSNVTRVIISLDHYDKEKVNISRHNDKVFDETIMAIKNLVNHKIYTTVTLCLTENFTTDDIGKYFDFVKDLKVQEVRVVMPIPQGKIEKIACKNIYKVGMRIKKMIKENYTDGYPNIVFFSDIESKEYLGCSAGANYVTLNNDGQVTPCVAIPLSFGNIKDNDLYEIYYSMGEYFKCSGKTCLGRQVSKQIEEMNISTEVSPLDEDISQLIASKCIIHGNKNGLISHCLLSDQ